MILIWTTQPAIGDAIARETLDAALAFAAYDQPIVLLASEAAVCQFRPQPESAQAGSKDISKLIKALPLYEVETIYLCQRSMSDYQLTEAELVLPVQPINSPQLAQLLKEALHVIRI